MSPLFHFTKITLNHYVSINQRSSSGHRLSPPPLERRIAHRIYHLVKQ